MDNADDEANPFGELSKLEPDAEVAQQAISRVRANLLQQSLPSRGPRFWKVAAASAAFLVVGFAWWASVTIRMIDTGRPHVASSEDALLDPELKLDSGIGPLKFGATHEEAVRALGKAERINPETKAMDYFSRGYSIWFNPRGRFNKIECYTHDARDLNGDGFRGHTTEGLRMGASRADIERIYGKPGAERSSADSIVLVYSTRGLEFTLKSDRLVRLTHWVDVL